MVEAADRGPAAQRGRVAESRGAGARMPDGKPDLSGLWRFNPGAYGGNIVADLKPQEIEPSADALYKQRMDDFGDDMKAVRRTTDKP